MTLLTRDTRYSNHMFPGAENNSFVSVSIIKTKASPMSSTILDSRLSAANKRM